MRSTAGHEGDLWLGAGGALYHSTDGGANFAKVATTAAITNFGFGAPPPRKDFPAIFMTGTVNGESGIFRSDDTGVNWVRINDDQHQYGTLPSPIIGDPRVYGRVYIGTNGRGIFYADIAPAQ
jgi:photosystem II stability/assembly factor-like uncharacterized protein